MGGEGSLFSRGNTNRGWLRTQGIRQSTYPQFEPQENHEEHHWFSIDWNPFCRLNNVVPPPPSKRRRIGLLALALGAITLALYLPTLRHDFVDYDDQQYVTENLHVRAGLTLEGLRWAFGYHAGNWHPLTWLSHMLDCSLYGLKAGGHHFTNALLHAVTSTLLFLWLFRMTRLPWHSLAVAALFAWHPLHVESVAWVAERKDVLCACFCMLTLWAYANYAEALRNDLQANSRSRTAWRWYVLTLIAFGLALMSKPMAVTLPCVLLLLDFWPLARLASANTESCPRSVARVVLEKLPFFLLSAGVCVLTLGAQKLAIVSTQGLPVTERLTHALVAYTHYLGDLLIPHGLAVYYPYETNKAVLRIILAATVLGLISIGVVWQRQRRPFLATGWLWFLGMLVPVIGFVQVGDQAWADRYTYLPSVGIFIAVVWLAGTALSLRTVRTAGTLAGVTLLLLTSLQLRHWRNTETLFTHTDRVTPRNHLAATLLGSLHAQAGRYEAAMAEYQRALSYRSNYAEIHFFIGHVLERKGKLDEAITEYRRALASGPMREQTHIFLGAALAKKGQTEEAVTQYTAALRLNPESMVAHNNLARLLHTQGRLEEAAGHYRTALKIDPNYAPARNNFGVLLLQQGQAAAGAAELRAALKLTPDEAETQFNLAVALNETGAWSEAAELFARSVRSDSPNPNAHYQFGRALQYSGKVREARSRYATAVLLQPDFSDALTSLAWLLATSTEVEFRNGPEAVRIAERACELTARKDPTKLKTLSAAYSETGRFPEALATVKIAISLARAAGRKELINECELMSKAFESEHPWRQATTGW